MIHVLAFLFLAQQPVAPSMLPPVVAAPRKPDTIIIQTIDGQLIEFEITKDGTLKPLRRVGRLKPSAALDADRRKISGNGAGEDAGPVQSYWITYELYGRVVTRKDGLKEFKYTQFRIKEKPDGIETARPIRDRPAK